MHRVFCIPMVRISIKPNTINRAGKSMSIVGRLMTTGFLSIFVFAGIFFATQIFKDTDRKIDQQGWIERPATVTSSGIDIDASSNEPYIPRVTYTYTQGGRNYTSSTITDSDPAKRDYRDAQAYILAYPSGGTATAIVNPDNPAESVLDIETAASLGHLAFGILFLCLFSGIPLAIIVGIWRYKGGGQNKRAKAARSRGKDKVGGVVVGVLFGGVFATAGIGMLIFMTILPLWRTAISQTWTQMPCVVERSELLRYDDGDDGPTYRIDILYKYDVAGQTYGSNRYSFASIGSSSGHKGKQKVLSQYPIGHQTTCYVDPSDPTNAVLKRGLTLSNLWGLFPIPFAAIGLFVIYFSLFGSSEDKSNNWKPGGKKKQDKHAVGEYANHDAGDGPVTLDPTGSRRKSFIGMLIFSMLWNGITGTILFFVLGKAIKGDMDTAPMIFLGIFQLVGLILAGITIKKLLIMFAPSVVLDLSRQAIPVGGSAELRWRIPGSPGRVSSVTIKLIGEESATYRRGTDTVTDTETFYEQVLVGPEEGGGESMPEYRSPSRLNDSGDEIIAIPLDTMHSFEAENNKILWKLEVKADVPRWPDPKDTYPLTVLPMPIDGS